MNLFSAFYLSGSFYYLSLKLKDTIGGSWRGSPTAMSFLQLKREIGRRLCGSNIWEHSSRMIILNYISFKHSNPVAAQVAPITRLWAKDSLRDAKGFS